MSMSVERQMQQYSEKIKLMKKNIANFEEVIQELLERLRQIDSTNNFTGEISKFEKRLSDIRTALDNNKLIQELDKLDKTKHVDLELSKQVTHFLHRENNKISEIQSDLKILEIKISEHEIHERKKFIFSQTKNLLKLEQEIVNLYDDNESKGIVKTFFKNSDLDNLSSEDIKMAISNKIEEYNKSFTFVKNKFMNSWSKEISEASLSLEDVPSKIISTPEAIKSTDDLKVVQQELNEKIVDERVRYFALQKIIKSIQKRGFKVLPENIRVVNENGEKVVIVYSKKITGEEAIFKVYLDGRFHYKFEGYEGHAHDEDAEPFIKDLSMYDVSLSKELKKSYINPDKIMKSAKKYIHADKLKK